MWELRWSRSKAYSSFERSEQKERQGSVVISHRSLGGQGAEVQAGEMLKS